MSRVVSSIVIGWNLEYCLLIGWTFVVQVVPIQSGSTCNQLGNSPITSLTSEWLQDLARCLTPDKISAVMSISDREKFNSENTKWFFSNFRGRIILSEFKLSSRSRRFNISSTNEFVPVQPESKQGRWGHFGHFLAEKMQAKCFSRNLGSEKEYFGIAECNGKLKETEQQNRGKEIVSLLEVGLWNRTTIYFSRSQGAFLKMFLSFMTLYLYKLEVSKDVARTENALAGSLERNGKLGIAEFKFNLSKGLDWWNEKKH